MNGFPSVTACDFSAAFRKAEHEPTCPSCSQPMAHAPGYFHCPQCRYAICEDYWEQREEPAELAMAQLQGNSRC